MNYWQNRNRIAQQKLQRKSESAINKRLAKYYKKAMEEAIKDFESTYDKLIATMEAGKEPTPADLYKLDKYWRMQGQLQNNLQTLGDKSTLLMQREFIKQYKEGYISLALPSDKAFTRIDTDVAKQAISRIWCADGKSWSQRVWDNTKKLQQTLNEELVNCIVTGKKTTDLKKKLMERFNVSYHEANTLVRTETAHIQTASAEQRYKDYGITEYEIWADKDERRCDHCGKLHQKRVKMGDPLPVPAHPNCRCCILPVIDTDMP